MFPVRKTLPHGIPPSWVEKSERYFITVCAQPKGRNQLCSEAIGSLIHESLRFRQDRGDIWIHLLLLMPDHVHAIISFSPFVEMEKILSDWKHYTCTQGGIKWEHGFLDRRLRKEESYIEKVRHIRMNPVRAGLIETPEHWPYVWENRQVKTSKRGR